MFQSMEEVMDYLYSRESKLGMDFGLARMENLLKELRNPEKSVQSIHIAGSNGKGSTLNALKEILMAQGLKVGSFTSPHLEKVNERMMINETMISDEEMIEHMNTIYPFLEEGQVGYRATFFEIITVISFLYFQKNEMDIALIETGLGGRLDCTNVITPLLSIITSISLEHTNILGNTLAEIASEKAGIIKRSVPVISGVTEEEPAMAIMEYAKVQSANLYCLNKEILVNEPSQVQDGQCFSFKMGNTTLEQIDLKMLGRHQVNNAALAIAAVKLLVEEYQLEISEKSIRAGLAKAHWAGRFEVLPGQIILDGAHNPAGMKVLLETLQTRYPDVNYHFVFTALTDKDYRQVLSMVDEHATSITFTEIDFKRAASAQELLETSKLERKKAMINWQEAIDYARNLQNPNDLVIVTGSLYFLALARPYIRKTS
ncbi:bifunctional folylpolyglutamate synthase/dihydrofolate synthase [Peribacillus loiseleuriae]|uniref:bifunctional folylpolyglutamate synthase/dihydrofolate synthase n=1 Tax=Peribacillus loiseleuriae TaxID=1679170 RepID=UPI00380279A7